MFESANPQRERIQDVLMREARLYSGSGFHQIAAAFVEGATAFGPWITPELAVDAARITDLYRRHHGDRAA